jgi:HEAT repeat protein
VAAPLADALQDADLKVRKGAATALGTMGAAAAPAIPALIRVLQAHDRLVCRLAAEALRNLGPAAEPALLQAMRAPDPFVRREAAWALRLGGAGRPAPDPAEAEDTDFLPAPPPSGRTSTAPTTTRHGR